jgi:quercetin dioxygenase-like cupin family protein
MAKRIRTIAALAFLIFCAQPAVSHHQEGSAQPAAKLTDGKIETYRPGAMTIEQIRKIGTIPNLNQGIQIDINKVPTRLIAWPGQGMVEGAIHQLTLGPKTQSDMYTYPVSEEALECIKGKGEVYLWGDWRTIEPGDVAYFPEGVQHGIRNLNDSGDFVLIAQITPPQLDLYEKSGLFDHVAGTFSAAKISELTTKSTAGNLTAPTDLKFRETYPDLRAWNINDPAKIRRQGALFNIFYGARFTGIGVPMVIILFPGYGTRNAGLHTGILPKGTNAHAHTHPISDDCVIYLQGTGSAAIGSEVVTVGPLDAVAAPVLVPHGGGNPPPERALLSGYGAPPQQELYETQGYLKDGKYSWPKFERLEDVAKAGSSGTVTATSTSGH